MSILSYTIKRNELGQWQAIDSNTEEIERIAKIISEATNISIEEMQSQTRRIDVRISRHVAMWFAYMSNTKREKTPGYITLGSIGAYFGNRDHSTVVNAVEKIEDHYVTNRQFQKNMDLLCDLINPALKSKLNDLIK